VIQLIGDAPGPLLESAEIEDVIIIVQLSLDFDGRPVVVAMKPFAPVALVTDEMSSRKHQVILGDVDLETLRHDEFHLESGGSEHDLL
jgi:hypothetical protein